MMVFFLYTHPIFPIIIILRCVNRLNSWTCNIVEEIDFVKVNFTDCRWVLRHFFRLRCLRIQHQHFILKVQAGRTRTLCPQSRRLGSFRDRPTETGVFRQRQMGVHGMFVVVGQSTHGVLPTLRAPHVFCSFLLFSVTSS